MVLSALCFRCTVASAHKWLLQVLSDLLEPPLLAKHAWALLNDLHHVPLVVRLDPLEVVVVVVTGRRLRIKLPHTESFAWCELFNVAADKQALHAVACSTDLTRPKTKTRASPKQKKAATVSVAVPKPVMSTSVQLAKVDKTHESESEVKAKANKAVEDKANKKGKAKSKERERERNLFVADASYRSVCCR